MMKLFIFLIGVSVVTAAMKCKKGVTLNGLMSEEECARGSDVCGSGPILIDGTSYTYYSGCVDVAYCGREHNLTPERVPIQCSDSGQYACLVGFHSETKDRNCTYKPGEEKCSWYTVKAGAINAKFYTGCLIDWKCGINLTPKMGPPRDVTYWPLTVTGYLRCLQVKCC